MSRELRPLSSLKETAKRRKPGYLERCLELGELLSDDMVRFTPENWIKIRNEFRLGLGDRLHKIAGPVGKAIHWPCLKGDGTMDLKPGSPCDKARKLLNKL